MKYCILLILVTACSVLTSFGEPNLIGEWETSFGRYSETITFNKDGTFHRVIEVVRGAKQDPATKSEGKWKLTGQELVLTSGEGITKENVRFTTPNSFEHQSAFGKEGVLRYERNFAVPDVKKSKENKAPIATADLEATEAKAGSADRKNIMDAMRGPVSKRAGKEVVFTGSVMISGDWAKFSGNVNAKDGKPFSENVADELELDFLAILQKVNGQWALKYFGWSGDIGSSIEARKRLPNVPFSLLPKIPN